MSSENKKALKIIDEEFEGLCRDFPYLMEKAYGRTIENTLVWNLIHCIKDRIQKECQTTPKK